MGIRTALIRWLGGERKMSSLELFREIYGGRESLSGVKVTVASSLEVATVQACVRVISEGVSQVPFRLFQEADGRKSPAVDHPVYRVLYRRPNAWQTSFEFRETLMMHALLTGNAFAFINRVGSAREVREMIPITGRVEVERLADSLRYKVYDDKSGTARVFPQEAIWHLRGPSWNSWLGMDAVGVARDTIGLSMALERSHAAMHGNGAATSGLLSVKDPLGPEQYKALSDWLDKYSVGGERHQKPMILDRGATFTPMQQTGVDSQHLETRKHQIEEICRVFRVMPIMVGHADKTATYASAEQMFLAHVVHTLTPWCERIEQSADVNLLSEAELKAGYYTKHTLNGLMRGAAADRAEFYAKALGAGGHGTAWMTRNEVRSLEELDATDGGDEFPAPPVAGASQEAVNEPA